LVGVEDAPADVIDRDQEEVRARAGSNQKQRTG
jgi:hypothetical protein